jgi:hypothetical protein
MKRSVLFYHTKALIEHGGDIDLDEEYFAPFGEAVDQYGVACAFRTIKKDVFDADFAFFGMREK